MAEEPGGATHDEIMAELKSLRKEVQPIIETWNKARVIRAFFVWFGGGAVALFVAADWVMSRWHRWFG